MVHRLRRLPQSSLIRDHPAGIRRWHPRNGSNKPASERHVLHGQPWLEETTQLGNCVLRHPTCHGTTVRSRQLLQGFGESMSPGIMGFTLLSLAALLTAVGMARLPDER